MNTKIKRGRPRKEINWTARLLAERANEYFLKCDSRVRMVATKDGLLPEPFPEPYSVEGLLCYLDISRTTFNEWRKQNSEIGKRAEKIHLRITANRVAGALDGSQNSSFAQFMLKNNNPEVYKDKVEVENSVSDQAADMFEKWSQLWNKI